MAVSVNPSLLTRVKGPYGEGVQGQRQPSGWRSPRRSAGHSGDRAQLAIAQATRGGTIANSRHPDARAVNRNSDVRSIVSHPDIRPVDHHPKVRSVDTGSAIVERVSE